MSLLKLSPNRGLAKRMPRVGYWGLREPVTMVVVPVLFFIAEKPNAASDRFSGLKTNGASEAAPLAEAAGRGRGH